MTNVQPDLELHPDHDRLIAAGWEPFGKAGVSYRQKTDDQNLLVELYPVRRVSVDGTTIRWRVQLVADYPEPDTAEAVASWLVERTAR